MGKGIYIKDFTEFPKCCFDSNGMCFAYDEEEHCCRLRKKERALFSQRVCGVKPSWCPLIEVNPHGDLIDKDKYEYPGDLIYEPVVIPQDM